MAFYVDYYFGIFSKNEKYKNDFSKHSNEYTKEFNNIFSEVLSPFRAGIK